LVAALKRCATESRTIAKVKREFSVEGKILAEKNQEFRGGVESVPLSQ
jgi:hypothetical protein